MDEHVFVNGGSAATILHADLDAFYASVEQRDDPRLAGRPVVVGGGVVLCASYEARARGVRSAMGGHQARLLCPDLVVVRPRMAAYTAASDAVFAVFRETSPTVEALSIDEAFLDVGGLRRLAGAPVDVARRLRAEVRDQVALPITVGVARTKFLAKVASSVAKPDGLLVVPPADELEFLHPLPVERLWGVGPVTARRLRDRGIRTVRDVARLPEGALVAILGPAAGRRVHALAHNRDARSVRPARRRGSIGAQRALGRGPHTIESVDAALVGLVDRVARRARAADRVARTVVLRLRYADFTRATRSHTLDEPTNTTDDILAVARRLLRASTPAAEQRSLTLIGVALANLAGATPRQLALPFGRRATRALDDALDGVRARFGSAAVTRAVHLGAGHDPDDPVPLLPDHH
jgi:DNA polymerase-4